MEEEIKMEMEEALRKRDRNGEGEDEGEAAKGRKRAADMRAVWLRMMEEETEEDPNEDWSDMEALAAGEYRKFWDSVWAGIFGSFDDTTPIGPKRYTDHDPQPLCARIADTLQIFSVKIAGVTGGLQWPLDVFGMIAARDSVDHNRNIIFNRTRDDCQTLTEECPCLALGGPTRAVVLLDPVVFEVVLKVKGNIESEDKDLSFLAVWYHYSSQLHSCLVNRAYTSKLSTLELTSGHVIHSVEATIDVQVINGSWPDGFGGQFTARTASINNAVFLLDSGNEEVPVTVNGMIEHSRSVASVEVWGELKVRVVAWRWKDNNENVVVEDEKVFTPKKAGRSDDTLNVGSCEMKVTVAWSMFSFI